MRNWQGIFQKGQPLESAMITQLGTLELDITTLLAGTSVATFSRVGTLTATTGTGRYYVPRAATIVGVVAAVGTAPTGQSILCDVNLNGTTVFTTQGNRPSIAAAATKVASTAVPDVTALTVGDLLSVDVDQIGSGVAGSDLTVTVITSSY